MQTTEEQLKTPARRDFLRGVGGAFAAGVLAPHLTFAAGANAFPFPISISDRAAGLRQQLPAFDVARQCGASAVEVDMGRLGAAPGMMNRLLDRGVRQQFSDAAETAGIAISSIALSAFEDQLFSSHPKAEEYADDLLYVMRQLDVAVGVLPIDADDDGRTGITVDRLKRIAPIAHERGLTIALVSALPADALAALLDAVDSPAIRAAVRAETGDDALAAVGVLGVERVAQIRYRHHAELDHSAGLARLVGGLCSAKWSGVFVIDRPAVAAAGDTTADVSSAVQRLRGLLAPTYS